MGLFLLASILSYFVLQIPHEATKALMAEKTTNFEESAFSVLVGMFLIFLLVFSSPILIAVARGHRNIASIIVLTILGGWTIIGWIVALIWALYVEREPIIISTQEPRPR